MTETPLGIVYPCNGEQIALASLFNYATSTQDALVAVDALVTQALGPPAAQVRRIATTQTLTAGVTATISYDTELYDTASMFAAGTPTLITIPSDGTYLVSVQVRRSSFSATFLSHRAAILVGGVERAFRKSDASSIVGGPSSRFYVSAFLPGLVAGNTITTTQLYTGTGTAEVDATVSVIKTANA